MPDDETVMLDGHFDYQPNKFDPSRSMKIAEFVSMTLDESRKKDPQGTIDYLFVRKEYYKKAFTAHRQRLSLTENKLNELQVTLNDKDEQIQECNKLIKYYKNKYKRELAMKTTWRFACIAVGVGVAVISFMLLLNAVSNRQQIQTRNENLKVPTSGMFQVTPPHVLASVNIYNGKIQGSGTVISKGTNKAAILTAAHNFAGKIGGEFFVYYPDGTYTKATLLAHDSTRDLALASVNSDTIIDHSYVPDKIPEPGVLSGVGYTNGTGPNYRTLSYTGAYLNSFNRRMWELNVTAGPFWDGDSGGGVFQDEALIGVTSQRDSLISAGNNTYIRRMYACSHGEILAFLNENKKVLIECGDWHSKPKLKYNIGDGPPLWNPSPNIPIHINEKNINDIRAEINNLKKQLPTKISGNDDGLKKPSDIFSK